MKFLRRVKDHTRLVKIKDVDRQEEVYICVQ
jgi:hypothetical protein